MKDLLSKRVLNAWRWAILLLPVLALGQASAQKPKIICDHAAPPRGMHYVCKSQCDCHLEGKLKNDDDGVGPAPQTTTRPFANACQPAVTSLFAPSFPAFARQSRVAGTVLIRVEIDEAGNVSDASIQQGHPMLAVPALQAVKRWKFNRGCSSVQIVSMRFDLEDESRVPSGV